jgi:hypothetical protein
MTAHSRHSEIGMRDDEMRGGLLFPLSSSLATTSVSSRQSPRDPDHGSVSAG